MKLKLPEGCYHIASTVYLPPGIRLVGTGTDKAILYRKPAGSILNHCCASTVEGMLPMERRSPALWRFDRE